MAALGRDAVNAVRTLTQNLTRLSRSGLGGSSRRADYLRLATCSVAVAVAVQALGKVKYNLVPPPGSLSAWIVPWCAAMIPLACRLPTALPLNES